MQMAMDSWWRKRWWAPLCSLAMGAVVFAAFAIGGNAGDGVKAFALFVVLAALFYFGSPHSDTLGGVGGAGRDERWAAIDLRAGALGGFAMILAAAGAWLYEIADGQDGSPYGQLLVIGGLAYIAALVVLRRRS